MEASKVARCVPDKEEAQLSVSASTSIRRAYEEHTKTKVEKKDGKPADVFLTDFCSHNIERRRVIISSSER